MGISNSKHDSKVERSKRQSRSLRGTIAETLVSEAAEFGRDDAQVLKFHGAYQQDDRDLRKLRKVNNSGKVFQFMVRVAVPAGILTAEQYLELEGLAGRYANGSLRLTTRQGVQFHGVGKMNLKETIQSIDRRLLTTLGACGDVQRNVMACPAPIAEAARHQIQELAATLSRELRPATRAYHEIWLDGERVAGGRTEEPFYGTAYLPRKFKVGVAPDDDNCVDVLSHDIGLLGRLSGGALRGFDLFIGGGMGMTHNRPETFATLARPLGFIEPDAAVEAVRTVAAIFRDQGNRGDRRQARLKYLIRDWGLERFRQEFANRFPSRLFPPCAPVGLRFDDHLGSHDQGDGRSFYGIHVQSGRIRDENGRPFKTALRDIIRALRPGVRITPQQNLLLTDLRAEDVEQVEARLRHFGIRGVEALSPARRYSMACPALPTCGLALGESERLIPKVLARLEEELKRLGMGDAPLTIRMTGCPNGCARPYTADLAFVARSPRTYHIYVGGRREGDRIADLFAADVAPSDFGAVLKPLFERWARDGRAGEGLGDYYQRTVRNRAPARTRITGREIPTRERFLGGQR